MNPEETMVENEQFDDTATDDTLQESVIEEPDESEEFLPSPEEEEDAPAGESKQTQQQGTSEPGWIKQRVNKAVEKAVAATEARMRAEFDKQMAPIREKLLNDEANELVRTGQVKDLETAKELVRYRQGASAQSPAPEKSKEQPRNAQGQFAPKEDPATSARIGMLQHQADRIKSSGGPDVIEAFRNDKEIQQAVISGEMDFYDVAEQLKAKPAQRKPPAPTRASNGVNGVGPDSIWAMTDEQFAKMDKRLDEGVRFTIKR